MDPDGTRYPVLPVEAFETAIREAKPLGLSGVKLTGGEPLLHPHFTRLLEIVRREGLGLTIETNGVLCTPEIAAEIAKSENPFVSVSLDGADAATHEWVRGVKGSFDAAVQGVRHLVAAGIRPQIILSLMRGNAHHVEAIIRLAEALGAGSVKFNIVQPTGRGERFHDGADGLEVAELIALGRRVETELAPATDLALYFDYPMAFRPLSRIASGDGCGTCGILGILGVIPSGHYALCGIGEQVPGLVFGAVGADPLDRVWRESPVLVELREGLPGRLGGVCAVPNAWPAVGPSCPASTTRTASAPVGGVCAGCLMKHQCLGSCVAQNYYRTGSLWAPFWFCEAAADASLFPVTRLGGNRSSKRGLGETEAGPLPRIST